jgi:hypothetical protein
MQRELSSKLERLADKMFVLTQEKTLTYDGGTRLRELATDIKKDEYKTNKIFKNTYK